MPKSRRLRRNKKITRKMRGGNDEALLNQAVEETQIPVEETQIPVEETQIPVEEPQRPVAESQPVQTFKENTINIAKKAKNVTLKAVDWLKGWFGIGQKQTGGKRRTKKSRKH